MTSVNSSDRRRVAFTLAVLALGTVAMVGAAPRSTGVARAQQRPVNWEIYSVSLDGRLADLSSNAATDVAPAVSPDGRRIAFVSDRGGLEADVYVMNVDGSDPHRLTNGPLDLSGRGPEDESHVLARGSFTTGVSWAPTNDSLVFDALDFTQPTSCSRNCGRQPNVFVMQADGAGLRQLREYARDPVWSPKGDRIAFTGGYLTTEQVTSIATMRPDGSGLAGVTQRDWAPIWSPTGVRIAFETRRGRATGPLWVGVMKPDGSSRRRLARGQAAAWSPDGRRLAFVEGARLHVVTTAGRGLRRLTGWHVVERPAWSPNGRLIAFVARAPGASRAAYAIVRPNGTGLKVLARLPPGRGRAPQWLPNGRGLVFAAAAAPSAPPPRKVSRRTLTMPPGLDFWHADVEWVGSGTIAR
jgi:TolB protein